MFLSLDQPLALAATLESGQAFRWRRQGDWFLGVVFGNLVKVRQRRGGLEFFCAPEEEAAMEPRLRDYLGLGADLESVYRSIAVDEQIQKAIDRYRGMRVLRQEPWECLISFICSANSNIRRISGNVEDIATAFGQPLYLDSYARCTFPTPAQLANAGGDRLRRLGLGYRAGYVHATAGTIAGGGLDLLKLRRATYEEALRALTKLPGVGDKVANCVLLFALDKPEAFPVDVWVRRALDEWYLDGTGRRLSALEMRLWARRHFGPHAGYANQYLFHDRRPRGKSQA